MRQQRRGEHPARSTHLATASPRLLAALAIFFPSSPNEKRRFVAVPLLPASSPSSAARASSSCDACGCRGCCWSHPGPQLSHSLSMLSCGTMLRD